MQLAASPIHLPQDHMFNRNSPVLSFPCRIQAMSDKLDLPSPVVAVASHNTQTGILAYS